MKHTMEEINKMDYEEFFQVFGNVVEHCALFAASIWGKKPFQDIKHLHSEFCQFIDALPSLGHEGILRSHPDLAGRIASQGLLTTESSKEQLSAGLNTLTPEEKANLTTMNKAYKEIISISICKRVKDCPSGMDLKLSWV